VGRKPGFSRSDREITMPTTPIEAVYEQGVLRPTRPIDLAEGARVEIIIIPGHSYQGSGKPTPAEVAARIAAMPLQSSPEGFSGEDHDAILYGNDSQ
jgi:predicted DNA-binding antitoxin AbrB/MazE fold protein